MAKFISIHSYRRGAGKSTLAANIAALLAAQGKRVCVVDANFQSPALHALFNVDENHLSYRLNDYLYARCDVLNTAFDVSAMLGIEGGGQCFTVFASTAPVDIAHILRHGYDVSRLPGAFRTLIAGLNLDILLVDNPAGFLEDSLSILALADTALITMRHDPHEFQGTSVLIGVARKFKPPRVALFVNETPAMFEPDEVKTRVAATLECEVAGVLPYVDELAMPGEHGLLALRAPAHPAALTLRETAALLMQGG